jgi:hypothetical protein
MIWIDDEDVQAMIHADVQMRLRSRAVTSVHHDALHHRNFLRPAHSP